MNAKITSSLLLYIILGVINTSRSRRHGRRFLGYMTCFIGLQTLDQTSPVCLGGGLHWALEAVRSCGGRRLKPRKE